MFNWDDLQIFLAIEKAGSLPGAAKTLNLSHSTVFRRINAFEDQLGVRLFDRLPSGFVLTDAGASIFDLAQNMQFRAEEIERNIAGQDFKLSGVLRLTTTHGMSIEFMQPVFKAFLEKYPDVRLDIQWGDQVRHLSRYETDVIILPSKSPPEAAFGRKLGTMAFALFTSADYIARHGPLKDFEDLSGHDVVGLHESFADQPFYKRFQSIVNAANIRSICDSFLTIREAIASGIGIGLLPCYYGHHYKTLSPLCPAIPDMDQDLWILTHRDLKNTVRVRHFMDFACAEIEKLQLR